MTAPVQGFNVVVIHPTGAGEVFTLRDLRHFVSGRVFEDGFLGAFGLNLSPPTAPAGWCRPGRLPPACG